ncbi:hypothetical protein T12_13447 [Trichinella patagoniensis]|uniref:PiggyBac transposable element-derived protein domain-containing protein n=1 Tax=Trichinella patagoniensis TaxID=990121 RepID=A0A0V0ZZE0_9BILA|nr:hypothetical protein T12_13447 [Trichinella patagoniensis]
MPRANLKKYLPSGYAPGYASGKISAIFKKNLISGYALGSASGKIGILFCGLMPEINWICDAENGYALKGLLYTGRNGEERQIDPASTKVGQLAQPFVNSNRNVFMDTIGTVFAHVCHDVLACLRKAARRDLYSTLTVYEQNRKVTMINYVPRKNGNVLLLTSCHAKLKKTKQRLMKGLAAQMVKQHIEMRYQNQKSRHKLNAPPSAMECPKIIKVADIGHKTTKSIKMPRARTSKINVKPLPFI